MIRRQTVVVLLVFAALVVLAVVLNRSTGQEPTPELTPTPEPVWSVESSEIVGLTVEDLRQELTLELARDEEDLWRLVQPEAMPADAARVERAVGWLSEPRPRAEIFDALDLSAFELDEPHYRIQAELADGGTLELTIGREAPTGGSRYALFSGRLGVLVFSSVGLDEVLQLGPDLIPTPTPEPSATPAATQTAPPESTQESEG